MAAVVSQSQIEFFTKLTTEKEFPPGSDIPALIEQFKTLNSASGSDWIEKALGFDDKAEGPRVAPPF